MGRGEAAWFVVALAMAALLGCTIVATGGCGSGACSGSVEPARDGGPSDAALMALGGARCAVDGGYHCAEAVNCIATCDRPGDAGISCRGECESCLDNTERAKASAVAVCLENTCAGELDLWEHQLELHRDCSILAKRPAGPRGGGQCAAEWTACFP